MESILEVEGLTKTYPDFQLHDVSFVVPYGTIMGLIGENGAGKSTTINAVLGLIHHGGCVRIFGHETESADKNLREKLGVVFGENNLHGSLTATEISKIMSGIYRSWDAAQFQNMLSQFDLPLKKQIHAFSRGMQVKLSIAVALSHHPELLILDEPTSGLDPVIRDDVLDVFLDFVQDERHSILVSSHITSDLEKIADYITFIHQGTILLSKEKDNLLTHYGILKCTQNQFERIDPADYLYRRNQDYERDLLVADRESIGRKYPDCLIDSPTLDEIMVLVIKGEKNERVAS